MSAQAEVVKLFRSVGCYVSVKSENRRARGTAGHPDMLVLHKRFKAPLAWEHKQKGEPASPEQMEFQAHWIGSGGAYGRGDYAVALQWLIDNGLLEQVA